MSNQETQSKPALIKKIEVGKFYLIHDKSRIGHPGLIIRKDEVNNRYLVIRFDSDKPGSVPKYKRGVRHITKLSTPTDKNVVNSYVRNRPFLCKRKDIGIELKDLKIDSRDMYLIYKICKRNPEKSSSFKH